MSSNFEPGESEKTEKVTFDNFHPFVLLLWATAFVAFLTAWPMMISLGILHSYFHAVPAISFGTAWIFGISVVLLARLVKYA